MKRIYTKIFVNQNSSLNNRSNKAAAIIIGCFLIAAVSFFIKSPLVYVLGGFCFSLAIMCIRNIVLLRRCVKQAKMSISGSDLRIIGCENSDDELVFKNSADLASNNNISACLSIVPVKRKNSLVFSIKAVFIAVPLLFGLLFFGSNAINHKFGTLIPNVFAFQQYLKDLVDFAITSNDLAKIGTYIDDYRLIHGTTSPDLSFLPTSLQISIRENDIVYLPETKNRNYRDNIILLVMRNERYLTGRRLVLYSKGFAQYSVFIDGSETQVLKTRFCNEALNRINRGFGVIVFSDNFQINLREPQNQQEQKRLNLLKDALKNQQSLPEFTLYTNQDKTERLLCYEIKRVKFERRRTIKSRLAKEFIECSPIGKSLDELIDCCIVSISNEYGID